MKIIRNKKNKIKPHARLKKKKNYNKLKKKKIKIMKILIVKMVMRKTRTKHNKIVAFQME